MPATDNVILKAAEVALDLGPGMDFGIVGRSHQMIGLLKLVHKAATSRVQTILIEGEVGSKKHYDPRAWMKKAEQSMKDRIIQACKDLKCAGKSLNQ